MNFSPAHELASQLETAWVARVPLEPFSETGQLSTPEQAYATQQAWSLLRARAGDRRVGHKIGLTSAGMRQQMGVDEPDFGELWASREAIVTDGLPSFDVSHFLQPRVEGEVAFLLGADLSGPGVTPGMVRAAAVAAALALEVVDSRIADWRIQLVDTIADNASFGGFALGGWSERLLVSPLEATTFTLTRRDEVMVSELGSAVLGGPLLAVAWLADKLSSLGGGLSAGDVVLSGSFGAAVPALAGDEFTLRGGDESPLKVQFVGS